MEMQQHDTQTGEAALRTTNVRIKELERLITAYQSSYYNGESEVDDSTFDALWNELEELDPKNPILQRVGVDAGNFPKAHHIMPMGSQAKVSSVDEFVKWSASHRYDEYLVEYKLDGASLELQYAGGSFVRAVTRGDGKVGDVISDNARRMAGFIESIDPAFTGGVRGEVVMSRSIHQRLYADKANCRNAANGLMKRKDGVGCENLTIITYDAWATMGDQPFDDEEGKLAFLKKSGFIVVPMHICHSVDEVIEWRDRMSRIKASDTGELDWDIDGLVIKERSINHADALRSRPERQVAFKFDLDEAATVIRAIEWSESGATYTPIALFDPVALNGTTVRRASLVNTRLIRELGLSVGSHVTVVKRGEIIPKITAVLPGWEGVQKVEVPAVCASCGSTLVDEGVRLYCPNQNCPKRLLHQLLKWTAVVDIQGLGEKLIRGLFDAGTVRCIADIYTLTVPDLAPYFLGEESLINDKKSLGAAKVIAAIDAKRTISLAKFIAGFDIEGVGETVADSLIAAGFNTLERMLAATEDEVAAVYGFADVSAHNFVRGIQDCKEQMLQLVASGLVSVQEAGSFSDGRLAGKSFCFTGELVHMKRSVAQELVKQHGGVVKSSVVRDLSYLVTNDAGSGSAKNKRAHELGVSVIGEDEFLAMLT